MFDGEPIVTKNKNNQVSTSLNMDAGYFYRYLFFFRKTNT